MCLRRHEFIHVREGLNTELYKSSTPQIFHWFRSQYSSGVILALSLFPLSAGVPAEEIPKWSKYISCGSARSSICEVFSFLVKAKVTTLIEYSFTFFPPASKVLICIKWSWLNRQSHWRFGEQGDVINGIPWIYTIKKNFGASIPISMFSVLKFIFNILSKLEQSCRLIFLYSIPLLPAHCRVYSWYPSTCWGYPRQRNSDQKEKGWVRLGFFALIKKLC